MLKAYFLVDGAVCKMQKQVIVEAQRKEIRLLETSSFSENIQTPAYFSLDPWPCTSQISSSIYTFQLKPIGPEQRSQVKMS